MDRTFSILIPQNCGICPLLKYTDVIGTLHEYMGEAQELSWTIPDDGITPLSEYEITTLIGIRHLQLESGKSLSYTTGDVQGLMANMSAIAEKEIKGGEIKFIVERINPDNTVTQYEVLRDFNCRPL